MNQKSRGIRGGGGGDDDAGHVVSAGAARTGLRAPTSTCFRMMLTGTRLRDGPAARLALGGRIPDCQVQGAALPRLARICVYA